MPKRIQRKRTKGWKMPAGAVYIGRPTKYGNPWSVKEHREKTVNGHKLFRTGYEHEVCKAEFVRWIENPIDCELHRQLEPRRTAILRDIHELANHDLACWCKLCPAHADGLPMGVKCDDCDPCHADVLLVLANEKKGGAA